MRISTIPHIYRNVRRWTEILSVLSKYGLADWLSRLNIEMFKTQLKGSQGEALALQTPERRIRLALTELGPTYIKLGQLLSTRPDLVGIALAEELKQLRDDVPADDPATVRRTIEIELGQPAEELFAEFEDVPVASASIGQVHRARLKTGETSRGEDSTRGHREGRPRGPGCAGGPGAVGRAHSGVCPLSPAGIGGGNRPHAATRTGFRSRRTQSAAVLAAV